MSHWSWQFSFPQEPADECVFDTVVNTHGRAIATWLVTKYRDDLNRVSDGLVEFVLEWTRTPPSLETVWDLAFGQVQLALKSGKLDVREVAVRLALRLTEQGHRGTWGAAIRPATIRLGSTLVQSVKEIRVDDKNSSLRVTICTSNGIRISSVRDAQTGSWMADGGESLPTVGLTHPIYLLPSYALPVSQEHEDVFEGTRPVAALDATMVNTFVAGIAGVADNAPQYLRWVERALRGIVVCPLDDPFRVVSGSGEDAPGVIHASHPLGRMDVAEILVHECAHQYFYMLQRVGPVDDGTDSKLYWSPPIRKNRPLSRILMAYHALANVRLFYQLVRETDSTDVAYVDTYEDEMSASVAFLDAPLRNNPALTALGRGLYEPLAERVSALPRRVVQSASP